MAQNLVLRYVIEQMGVRKEVIMYVDCRFWRFLTQNEAIVHLEPLGVKLTVLQNKTLKSYSQRAFARFR